MRLVRDERCSAAEVARRLGFSAKHVCRVLRKEGVRLRAERHPSDVPHGEFLYNLWARLRSGNAAKRPTNAAGRAVRACEPWRDFWLFYDWAIASGYKPGALLSVLGDEREASPQSCHWMSPAARLERRRETGPRWGKRIRAFGETKTIAEWIADPRCSVPELTLRARLKRGVAAQAALSVPAKGALPKPRAPRRQKAARVRPDWKEVVRLRVDERLTMPEIAARMGIGVHILYNGWRRHLPESAKAKPLPYGQRLRPVFQGMRHRCIDPNDPMYPWYGGRGARVSAEWTHFTDFHAWAIASGYRPGLQLTRKQGKRIYSPANCLWAERDQTWSRARRPKQAPPERRIVEAFGERKGITAWSRDPRCKVTISGLGTRLARGMDAEEALTRPSRSGPQDRAKSRWIEIWGETKTLADWLRDRRCKVSAASLAQRLKDGLAPEEALTRPPYWRRRPGEVAAPGGPGTARAPKRTARRGRRG